MPPVCDAGGINGGPYNIDCSGEQTTIQLDGSGSYGSQDEPISFKWTTDCVPGSISPDDQPITTLTLGNPGAAISCKVTLVVENNDFISTGCEQTVNMTVCSTDCLGNVGGGAVVDQCGVCDGDGKSCVDCLGNPNGDAKVDRCGVCDGDGQSCLECSDTDVSESLVILDGNLDKIRNAATSLGKRLVQVSKKNKRAQKNFVARIKLQLDELYSKGWHHIWVELPRVIKSCANSTFCAKIDNQPALDSFNQTSQALLDLTNQVAKRLQKNTKGRLRPRDKRLVTIATNTHSDNVKETGTIPRFVSKCD